VRDQGGGAVFPGRSGSPIAYGDLVAAPAKADLDTGSPHGWRSVIRDWASDTGRIDRDLAEAALAHALNAVEGAYRRQRAIEARRPAMEAYAQWLVGDAGADVFVFPATA
jgi:integrase